MVNKIKTLLNNKIIKWVIIPGILLILWAVLTLQYMIAYNKSLFVLSYAQTIPSFQYNTQRIIKGEKITGEFVAQENYLGIVWMRFQQFLRIPYANEDTLVFRIKEKNAKVWYYQNNYKSGLTFDVPFLPFGFPIISHSKGKTYVFELESLQGNNENGVILSQRMPNFSSSYKIPRSMFLSDKKDFFYFFFKKVYTSFQTIDILFSSFIYLIPLILYFVYLSPLQKPILRPLIGIKNIFFTYPTLALLLLIVIDTIFLQINNDILYGFCMIIWIILLRFQKQNSIYTFVYGFIATILTPILFAFNNVTGGLEASSWAFVFFATGTLQILFENKSTRRKA